MRRAGAVLLGSTLVALFVWLVPLHAASSAGNPPPTTDGPGGSLTHFATTAQVRQLVAASVRVQRLSAHATRELGTIYLDNVSALDAIPISCASAMSGCVFGDTRSHEDVVLFGDSHARMWLPAIEPIARAEHLKLIVIGRNGCPLAVHRISRLFGGCASVVDTDIQVINHLAPAAVILADRTTYPGATATQWQAGLTDTIDRLRPSRARIAVIGDIQVFNAGVVSELLQCLSAHATAVQDCSVPNPNVAAPGQEQAERRATALAGDLYVDPTPWLCTASACSPVIGGNIVYWDAFHVSWEYSAYLSGVMGRALGPFLAAAAHGRYG